MNLLPREEHEDDELFEITAMVDVVFILLAFFVLSVAFEMPEQDLVVGHADTTQPAGASAEDFPAHVIVRVWTETDGSVQLVVGDRKLPADDFDQLTALLTYMDTPQIGVVIAAADDLTVQQTASTLDAVLASPMKKVSLTRLQNMEAKGG